MPQIIDVGPVASPDFNDPNHSPIGRMLSIACSPDGEVLFAGSYSNLWASYDKGKTWNQVAWPQPEPPNLDVPGSIGGWCAVDIAIASGWRVDRHPRCLATLTRSGHADLVGFGDCGVWAALGNGDGTFQPPRVVINNFGYQAGGWQVDKHPRFVVDLNNDDFADIVGFGDAGVWTAIGNGDGTFQEPRLVLENYGYAQDWRVDKHPRFLAHLTNSKCADIVGFGEGGVWVALGNGDGTFSEPLTNPVLFQFSVDQGWEVEKHPRLLGMLTSSGFDDIVGFGNEGVFVALSNGDGTFQVPHAKPVLNDFGYNQGWRVDKHLRYLANTTGSGYMDIVGFGDPGVFTALTTGDGGFMKVAPEPVLDNFGYDQSWRVDEHPRFLADLNGDGIDDIVGFGDAGVWTALGIGNGKFAQAKYVLANFGMQQGWRVDKHPRFVADLKGGTGRSAVIGCGDAGVWTGTGDGHGGFPTANFVLANFGYMNTVLALLVNDRIANKRGIWRSTDGGANWSKVYSYPKGEAVGELAWAFGSDHLVYAAVGSALAISKNAGTTFETVFPWGRGEPLAVNHVAVWQKTPADPWPEVIYALGYGTMFLSLDGGTTWVRDPTPGIPTEIGASVSSGGNGNAAHVMVISPRNPFEVYIAHNGTSGTNPATLYHGNYSGFFLGTSVWDQPVLPNLGGQDSGNVFLATTQPRCGDLLFYGAQRSVAYVGPLDPSAPTDGQSLGGVHVDLHGVLLSPDFRASLNDGVYTPKSGTVWLLSDGGIYWSTDGGQTFVPAQFARTLSCVNVAGVSYPGLGPALSLNTGDNDGFYSMDGGQTWQYQEYGGGDNDCSFADPLRPYSMMVWTPRWGHTVSVYETVPGSLPDARTKQQRRATTGPPIIPDSGDAWNADSYYGNRGSRSIVLGLPNENAPAQGDYVFILFHAGAQRVVVRTQNIFDIASPSEWITTATGPGQGKNVYLQGPPLPGPLTSVLQAVGGHTNTVFYASDYPDAGDYPGGVGSLWTWRAGATSWTQIVPAPQTRTSAGATTAVRFFASPYQPNLIYLLDADSVKRSEDGGQTWSHDPKLQAQLTWNGQIPISWNDNTSGISDWFDAVLTDMQFYPNSPLVRFAVGEGGVCYTFDGENWTQLLHAGALTGRPANCYFDWISDAASPTLYVSFAGRSLVKITNIQISPIF